MDFRELYEIERSLQFIQKFQAKNVALQFPDSLLPVSSRITSEIESGSSCKTFILADTSYGSCCIDEVAAQHVLADVIIHYGEACLSPYGSKS